MSIATMKELHQYLLLHGHSTEIDKLELNERIKDYAKEISQSQLERFDGKELAYISKLELFRSADRFMTDNFKLHKVGFLSNHKLEKILNHRRIRSLDDLVRIFNKSAKMVDPFCIPLDCSMDHILGGRLIAQTVVTDNEDDLEIILPQIQLFFSQIKLPKVLTTITPTSYVHEITHTQLESQKGVIEEYYNSEVLSIFLEFVHSYHTNKDAFTLDFVNRLQHILVNYYSMFMYSVGHPNPEREYHEADYYYDTKYLVSNINAVSMMHLYLTSDQNIRNFMMDGIQNVFDGKMSVEDYLKSIDVSFKSSLDPMYPKQMVKKLEEL